MIHYILYVLSTISQNKLKNKNTTCCLNIIHKALGQWSMVESIRTLLCYFLVRFSKLGKFDGVILFQDVTISPTKHFTEKENNKDADFNMACFKLV